MSFRKIAHWADEFSADALGEILSIICNCTSSKKLINERFDLNQLIELTNSFLGMFVLQLRNASLDGLENYILIHAKK